jgi:DNA-binding GntR family transcriptional regulator
MISMANTPSPSKSQLVYDHLLEGVVGGRLTPGQSLHIGKIADETGVSLIPVREALRRLESEGVVSLEHHRGARVVQLEPNAYREIMQTQAVLDGLAVSLSAPHLDTAALTEARSLNQKMNAAHREGDFHRYNEASLEFHRLLQSACPNGHLRETLERGQLRVAAVRAAVIGYSADIAERLSDEHDEILDRIIAGAEPAEIERLVREHRDGTSAHDADGLRAPSDT